MKRFILSLSVLCLMILPLQARAESEQPKLYAVSFHADWCGSCKILGPQMQKAKGVHDLKNHDVLFVKLDLTDKTTSHQAALMATALGLKDYYAANNGKTGYVLLVDAATGQDVGRLTKDMKADQIAEMIKSKF